ncbi:hypothetical protein AGMMS50230_08280 [Spirochaetia bacterium]|nr:hypothetical protein AGMMS50230_08280 [Spirochaetia bacterium]
MRNPYSWYGNKEKVKQFWETALSIIKDYENPEFPEGTEFGKHGNRFPIALVPKPDGKKICIAFDTMPPRPFPEYATYSPSGEYGGCGEAEFYECLKLTDKYRYPPIEEWD